MLKPFSDYTDQSNYLGDTFPDFLIALVGYDRIFEANEEEVINRFENSNLVENTDYMRSCIGNFCGPPTNFLLVHKDCVIGVAIAENAKIEIAGYPVLDDEIYSRYETEETKRRWEDNLNDEDRAEWSLEELGEELTDWNDIVAHPDFSQLQERLLID